MVEIREKSSPLDSVDVAEVYRLKKEKGEDEVLLRSINIVTTSGSISSAKEDVRIMDERQSKEYPQSGSAPHQSLSQRLGILR